MRHIETGWLTKDQKIALEAIESLIDSDDNCLLLKGYAGTGKTYLTKLIAQRLRARGFYVLLMAPTGRAARVLEQKTGFNASTIHKAIYTESNVIEEKTGQGDRVKVKFKYELRNIESNIRTVYLIDESSLISDKNNESDFLCFGSGRLLKDILDFIALTNKTRKDKVVFIGDPAQLPPVSDNLSGALDRNYLNEYYGIHPIETSLTEVVRQAEGSGILQNAFAIRNLLGLPKRERIGFAIDTGDDVRRLGTEDVALTYSRLNPQREIDKCLVVNFSNKNAFDQNEKIRRYYDKDLSKLHEGELLMVYQNSYLQDVTLYNGSMAKVISVSPEVELKDKMKSYDQNGVECTVCHKFRQVSILVEGHKVPIECMILENFLFDPNPTLNYSSTIALYLDFKFRNPQLKVETPAFKDALKADPYFNALKVKFGYAVTCHKAQGGEWENVIVNMDVALGAASDNYLRWTYTAMTRAAKALYFFNFKKNNALSKLKYHAALLDQQPQMVELNEISLEITDHVSAKLKQFGLSDAPDFLKSNFYRVLAIMEREGVKIIQRKPSQFCEEYVFRRGNDLASLKMYYNGKNKFTRTTAGNTGKGFSSNLSNDLQSIWDNSPRVNIIETTETTNDKHEELTTVNAPSGWNAILYNELRALLDEQAIQIERVDCRDYLDLYHFRMQGAEAAIQFYYNGDNQFTSARPNLKDCNSNELLQELEKAINHIIRSNT